MANSIQTPGDSAAASGPLPEIAQKAAAKDPWLSWVTLRLMPDETFARQLAVFSRGEVARYLRPETVSDTPASPLPRYMVLHNVLKEYIFSPEGSAAGRLPTEEQLAAFFGISRRTVRNALELLESDHRICRIKRRGTLLATEIAPNDPQSRQQKIGVVFPAAGNGWPEFFPELERTIARLGYAFRLRRYPWFSPEEEVQAIRAIRRECEGMILYPGLKEQSRELVRQLVEEKYPLILFDQCRLDASCSTVSMDHFHGAYQLTRRLLDLGCRRPALIRIADRLPSAEERAMGYFQALSEAGLKPGKRICRIDENYSHEGIFEFIRNSRCDSLLFTVPGVLYHYSFSAPPLVEFLRQRNLPTAAFDLKAEAFEHRPFLHFSAVQPQRELASRVIAELTLIMNSSVSHPTRILIAPHILSREELLP